MYSWFCTCKSHVKIFLPHNVTLSILLLYLHVTAYKSRCTCPERWPPRRGVSRLWNYAHLPCCYLLRAQFTTFFLPRLFYSHYFRFPPVSLFFSHFFLFQFQRRSCVFLFMQRAVMLEICIVCILFSMFCANVPT